MLQQRNRNGKVELAVWHLFPQLRINQMCHRSVYPERAAEGYLHLSVEFPLLCRSSELEIVKRVLLQLSRQNIQFPLSDPCNQTVEKTVRGSITHLLYLRIPHLIPWPAMRHKSVEVTQQRSNRINEKHPSKQSSAILEKPSKTYLSHPTTQATSSPPPASA